MGLLYDALETSKGIRENERICSDIHSEYMSNAVLPGRKYGWVYGLFVMRRIDDSHQGKANAWEFVISRLFLCK